MRRRSVHILLLAIPLLTAAATSAEDGMLDNCRYTQDAQAQAAWRPREGGSPVRMISLDGRPAVHLPCHVAEGRAQEWHRALAVDLTKAAGIQLEVYCPPLEPIRPFRLALGDDGARWGVRPVERAELREGWNLVRFHKAQARGEEEEQELDFSRIRVLRLTAGADRPPSAHLAVRNLRLLPADTQLPLDRDGVSDYAETLDGTVHRGVILNEQYELITRFGRSRFEARRVVGMTLSGNVGRVLLNDGQIYSGVLADGDVLRLLDGDGRTFELDLRALRRWSYRISPTRPEAAAPAGSYLVIGNDRVTHGGFEPPLRLTTSHGTLELPEEELACLEGLEGGGFRARLLNGSVLAGALEPATVEAAVEPGGVVRFESRRLSQLVWPGVIAPPEASTCVKLQDGQCVYGRVAASHLTIKTHTGPRAVEAGEILSVEFDPIDTGRVTVRCWGETAVAGRLLDKTIRFSLAGRGTELSLNAGQIVSLAAAHAR